MGITYDWCGVMVNGMLTNDDVRKLVEIMLLQSTQREAAGLLGVSTSYLNDYLHFRRDPGPALLDGLGLEKVTLYRFVSSEGGG